MGRMMDVQTAVFAAPCDTSVRHDPITHSSRWGFYGSRHRVEGAPRRGDLTTFGMNTFFHDASGLQPVGGRIHYSIPNSKEYEFRCTRKMVEPPFFERAILEKTTDLVKPAFTPITYGVRRRPERRHSLPIPHIPPTSEGKGISQRKQVRIEDPLDRSSDGTMRCQERRGGPSYIEDELCRKQRVGYGDLNVKRNNLGIKSEGDKSYRFPDYCGDFFQKGELAVGSSFVRGSFKKNQRRNESSIDGFVSDQSGKKKSLNFIEAQKMRQMKEIEKEVKGLIDWEVSRLGGDAPWSQPEAGGRRYVEPSDSEDEGYKNRQEMRRKLQEQKEAENTKGNKRK
eukprot:GDKK01017793.1.p1 GENE.GDKK01017793.1~~GDKK01017793.1.p1  ORF type:complete len:339 (+),score=51.18 GDKK01017793.1:20-1036(+)